MKSAISLLPLYLQHSNEENLDAKDKRKIKNNEKVIKNLIGSTMIAMSSASNETKADAMARGKTAQKIWFDELAFMFFNKAIMEATIPAFNKASENARKYGMPYNISITTTPGDLASPHGTYAYKFKENCINFNENMYDMYKHDYKELRKTIAKSKDKNGFLFIQFHYYELGYTDDWYIECTKALDPVRARREYLLEWINTNGNSPFDTDDMEMLIDMARLKEKKSETVKITKYYTMEVYSYYKGKLPVVISCDVGQGIGRDYNTIVVINPETLDPMAIFKSNNITSTNFKKVIVKLVQRYYPHCVLTVENNSIGTPLINELRESPVGRLLYKERKVRTVDVGVDKFTSKKKQEGWAFGHNVNNVSRPLMTTMLENLVKYNKSKLAYPELVEEIKFMEFRNGRIQHSSATHDDVTMAYLGGLYVIKYGKNMKGKGITFNLAEDLDEAIQYEDVDLGFIKAGRVLKHNANYYDRYYDDDDELGAIADRFLDDEYETETAGSFFSRQRNEYLKSLDVIDGVADDDETMSSLNAIPKKLQGQILGNSSKYQNLFSDMIDDDEDEGAMNFFKRDRW